MYSCDFRNEKLYLLDESEEKVKQLCNIKEKITAKGTDGVLIGLYDEKLSIFSISEFLLNCLDYSLEEFKETTDNSLVSLFVEKRRRWLDANHFTFVSGDIEGEILDGMGNEVLVHMYKEDITDLGGEKIWVLSFKVNWEPVNNNLLNAAIQSGAWNMDSDRDGNIVHVYWSDKFRQMLGFKGEEDFPNVLESWADRLHPTDKNRVVKQLHDSICDKQNLNKYNVEYRLKDSKEVYHWFKAIGEIVRRRDGSASHMAGVFINIDEEKTAKDYARKSEAFHRAFTKSNLCEYYVDLQNNTFESLKVESSLMTIFEKSNTWDQLIDNFVKTYVCEEDKEAVRKFYDRSKIAKKIEQTSSELSLECKIVLNGDIFWMRNVVMRGELDGSKYAMIFLRDITETKREQLKQKELQAENDAMTHLVSSMVKVVDHFAVCDIINDTYEYHNINMAPRYPSKGRYADLLDRIQSELKMVDDKKTLEEILSPDGLRTYLTQEDDIYKFEYCTKDESMFRIASLVPLEWTDGILSKILWISIDITNSKRIEIESRKALKDALFAAERANRAKTEFLTNMSHDIRTPMNAIVGLTALAGANIDNQERVLNCLSKITASSRHLLQLINEVLDMARIESGKISLNEEEFSISELIDNMINMVKPNLDAHNHQFQVNIRHIEHEAVRGDSLRIQQVFMNLMSNAIKYTPDGGNIQFTIEEKTNAFSELGCFEFTIEDNGIGIEKSFQEVMFQPFTRADDHRITKIQGTGLGMAITQNIVHFMNGDIKVQSEINKGTKVTVTIYLKLQNKDIDSFKDLIKLPVLVVDDEITACESTVATLQEIGIVGEWVVSGVEAIDRTLARHKNQEDYFAIIMDWQMPGMDGVETTRQIRKVVGPDVTIILLTAYDFSNIEEEARAAGVDMFIEKPLFPSRLSAAFKKVLNGQLDNELSAKDYLNDISDLDYTGKRILLVEDNDLNREIAAEIVGMSKATVDQAENGRVAVEKIYNAPEGYYDLVLMDIQMPVLNGYEATATIRALPGDKGNIPIIALTANAFAEDVQLAKNTGMNGHIAKPIELDKLQIVLKKWLGKKNN